MNNMFTDKLLTKVNSRRNLIKITPINVVVFQITKKKLNK